MKYRPGKYDGLIDVALLQKKLDEAATADIKTRDQIYRLCRSYIRKMRVKAKKEHASIQQINEGSLILICEFTSFDLWVSKARSWLGGISGGGAAL